MKQLETLLQKGMEAPSFAYRSRSGEEVPSESLLGKLWILYFYPKDDTPGCTKEACGFRDHWPEYEKLGVPVLGCSPDSKESHLKFTEKYNLPFELVSDPEKTIAKSYGVWGPKQFMGRTFEGVHRVTYVIGPDQRIQEVFPKVKPAEHAEQLIETIQNLQSELTHG